jgi:hypothetical protein
MKNRRLIRGWLCGGALFLIKLALICKRARPGGMVMREAGTTVLVFENAPKLFDAAFAVFPMQMPPPPPTPSSTHTIDVTIFLYSAFRVFFAYL